MQYIDLVKMFKEKKSLVVDDMPDMRSSLSGMLKEAGVDHVNTAANSQQAIELCEQQSYDLILCDYNLGEGRDGQQILEELRFRKLLKNSSLFIMVTAESSTDMVLGALEYQPDEYLTKPITTAVLRDRLTRVVTRHEEMLAIKKAMDNEDYQGALTLSQAKVGEKNRYASLFLKTEAEMLFRLKRYDEAQEIYQKVLKNRPLAWAQLGLGKIYIAQEKFEPAEKILLEVINQNSRYIEAHEMLAEIYARRGKFKESQQAMSNAADMSPKSVLRQRKLANLAKRNHDVDVTLRARKTALKVGEHSCHYTPQDYFDLVSELMVDGHKTPLERQKNAKDAEMYISRAERKHLSDKSIKLQTLSAHARLSQFNGNKEQAEAYLDRAQELHDQGVGNSMAELELAQAMMDCGQKSNALELLISIDRKNPENEDVANRIDALVDEPISTRGKVVAADLNKQGIKLFEDKSFDGALDVFVRASKMFPKHVGLHLNIVQVALEKYRAEKTDSSSIELSQEHLQHIHDLSATHPQFRRYQYLLKEIAKEA
jgi:tetratricopeptide (TPR) repeat protein